MIFDSLPQATIVAFRDDDSLQLNAAARELLGVDGATKVGTISDLHALIQATTPLQRAYDGEHPAPESIDARIEGARRALFVECVPLYRRGQLQGALCTLRDVTDRVLDDEMGDDLLGRAAHDLRTPLTALKASAQLIGRGFDRLDAAARARTLGLLLSQIDKLSSRIDDVLDAARIRRGRFDLEPQDLDVAAELRQIVAELRGISGSPAIDLQAPEQLPAHGDRARLKQIVTRLAYELAERTVKGAIAIVAKPVEEGAEITVEPAGEIVREPKKRTGRRLAASIVTRLGGAFREDDPRVVLTLPKKDGA